MSTLINIFGPLMHAIYYPLDNMEDIRDNLDEMLFGESPRTELHNDEER